MTWIVERRRYDPDDDTLQWERVDSGATMQEAAWRYNRKAMYIRSHEQRLLDPDGNVILHHQGLPEGNRDHSPPLWRDRWRDLLVPE